MTRKGARNPAGMGDARESQTMKRPRKTRDCWRFYLNYGHGWEHEITEYTRAETKENAKAYRENCNYPLRVVFGRERIENPQSVTT